MAIVELDDIGAILMAVLGFGDSGLGQCLFRCQKPFTVAKALSSVLLDPLQLHL